MLNDRREAFSLSVGRKGFSAIDQSLGFVPLNAARSILQNPDRMKEQNLTELGFAELLQYLRIN